MASRIIDVWNIRTFDKQLLAALKAHALLIQDCFKTDQAIFLSHDLGRSRAMLRPSNPYRSDFLALTEAIELQMRSRVIRAWHYARITEQELDALKRDGIHLSTPHTLRRRLTTLVELGILDARSADTLYQASPFHADKNGSRSNKFWMTSHPHTVDDSGVEPLLAHWGGEVASMWMQDPALLAPLASIGKPRIVEVAVPIEATSQSYSAAEAVIAAFGWTLDCLPEKKDFDLYVNVPLKHDAILGIHTEGEPSFVGMGRTFPQGYVDVDIGRWKKLTGEDY